MSNKNEYIISADKLCSPLKKIFIPCIAIILTHFIIWNKSSFSDSILSDKGFLIIGLTCILGIFLSIILHEGIHAIVFMFTTKCSFSCIKFGIKDGNPYCHCSEKMRVKHYTLSLLAPFIILGILPSIIGVYTNEISLTIFGIFNIISSAGDLCIRSLLKSCPKNSFIEDHPCEIGFYLYE